MSDFMKDMRDALAGGSVPITLEMLEEERLRYKKEAAEKMAKKASSKPEKKGGRFAADISRKDFLEKVKKFHNTKMYTEESSWLTETNTLFSLDAFMESPAVKKDLGKILFDTENNTAAPSMSSFIEEGNLIGLQTLDNGLQFIGFCSGGDWEYPIFLIVYWDGKSFRGYIPVSGNCVNTMFRCAFGSEMDSDYGPYGSRAHAMDAKYEGLEDEELMLECLADLGLSEPDDDGKIFVDWNAIEKDILNRIVVKK